MKKFKTNLFSVKIIIIAIFLTSLCISCSQKDDIATDPAPALSTNCCEKLVLYAGGIASGDPGSYDDNFSLPFDVPERRITGPFAIPLEPANQRQYDQPGTDNSLVQTFSWSSSFGPITCATLEFEAKPEGTQDFNDNIQIYPYHLAENTAGVHAMAGAWLGSDGVNIKGLLQNAWNQNYYPLGEVFTIDLKNFPSDKFNRLHGGQKPSHDLSGVCYFIPGSSPYDYQIEGDYDLTRVMNQFNFLDVFIGDDTNVDYMKLTLLSCDCDID